MDDLGCLCQTGDSSVPLCDVHRTREFEEWPQVDRCKTVQRQHTTRGVLCQPSELTARSESTGSTRHRQADIQSAATAGTRVRAWIPWVEWPSPRPAPEPTADPATTQRARTHRTHISDNKYNACCMTSRVKLSQKLLQLQLNWSHKNLKILRCKWVTCRLSVAMAPDSDHNKELLTTY